MSRICMIAHSYFPHNSRTRPQAFRMVEAGHEVEMICPRGPGEPKVEDVSGVLVNRIGFARDRSRGKFAYLMEYASFLALSALKVEQRERSAHFDVVVVHNIPEQLVFAAWPAKRRGAAVVIDFHDPLPELFADKYGLAEGSRVKRLLERLEILSANYADHVLVATAPMEPRLMKLGYPQEKITQIFNSPQPPVETYAERPSFVVVYSGSLFERYGMETVLRGLAIAVGQCPEIELHLFGSDTDSTYVEHLKLLAEELGIGAHVAFNGYVAPLALRRILSSADLGICPMRRSCHIDLAYPTKLLEYLSYGVPALAVRTPALEELFAEGEVRFYDDEDAEDFAAQLVASVHEISERRALPERPSALPIELSWSEMGPRYEALVERLASESETTSAATAFEPET